MNPTMSDRLNRFFGSDASVICHLLTLAAYLLSLGFFFGITDSNTNYRLIEELAPPWVWGTWFFIVASFKVYGNLYRLWWSVRITLTTLSAWSWMCIALSFVIYDPESFAPTEPLLVIPALCEIWIAASLIYKRNHCRRRNDRKR